MASQGTWSVRRAARAAALALALGFLGAASLGVPAWGQSQAINGTIRGRVADASNAAIPGAAVIVTNVATGFRRSLTTNGNGLYVASNLPLGTYIVTVQKAGFTTVNHPNVVLNAGTAAEINASLQVGQQNQTVTVTGGAPVLDATQTNVGGTIDTRAITSLPLVSRNPYNFILFQPGVSGHPNPELGIPRTVNTNGLLDRINYQLDGMVDTETNQYGLRLFPISNSYVREVQTVSTSYAPEFGDTVGDIYNVITDSGTNQIHGMFNFTWRPSGVTARPILLNPGRPKPDLTQQDFSGNLGGPIIRNKLFVFGSYEHLRRGQPSVNTIDPADAQQLGLPASLLATLPGVEHAQFLDLRVDYDPGANDQFFVRYNYFRNEFPFNTGVGGLNAADASTDFHDRAHIGGFQWIHEFGSNIVNELRLSDPYRKERHVSGPLTGPGPQIDIPGAAIFNGTTSNGAFYAEKIPSGNDNLTWIRGAHTFKMGFNFQDNVELQQSPLYTQYTFSDIADYLAAENGTACAETDSSGAPLPSGLCYQSVHSNLGNSREDYHSRFWGLFWQDSWQITPSLLVNYGLRYDQYIAPPAMGAPAPFSGSFHNPTTDFAPRLGFAWKLNDKTVLRADGGIFFAPPATDLWFNALSNNGSNQFVSVTVSPLAAGAPLYPSTPSSNFAPATPDVTVVSPSFRNAYTINTSLQLQRQLTRNDSLTLVYVYTAGRELTYLYNYNLINPTATLADGRPVFDPAVDAGTRLVPAFNNITMQAPGANSNYNALEVNYRHRWSQGFQFNADYTWSHTLNDAPTANSFEVSSPIEDPTDRARDYGDSYVNRPNALTLTTVWQPTSETGNAFVKGLLNHNQFSLSGNLSSGDTQGITTGTNLTNDGLVGGAGVTRPLFVGRNTLRGAPIYQFDLRYTRTLATLWERLQPQFFIEAQNLFNHPNVTEYNTNAIVSPAGLMTTPPSMAPLGSVLEARIVQFGVQAKW